MKDCKIWVGRDKEFKRRIRMDLSCRRVTWEDGGHLLDWPGVPNDDAYYITDNKMIRSTVGREFFDKENYEEVLASDLLDGAFDVALFNQQKGNGNE